MELLEPKEKLAIPPQHFTKGLKFTPPEKIMIYDDTLRDGEQMPGVAFSPAQKVALAKALSDIGVDVMDVAFPRSTKSDCEALQLILLEQKKGNIREDVEILAMCRSNPEDIDCVVETVNQVGIPQKKVAVLILSTLSDLHLKYKLGKTLLKREKKPIEQWIITPVEFYRQANIKLITDAIKHARKRGLEMIEFASEDGSRCDVEYAGEWIKACKDAGGTRMCFSDTAGVLTPESVDHYIPKLVSFLGDTPLTAHFHNDFGLGAINTVRALMHGATHAGVTANGIGERAGNTSLHQVVMVLKELYGITLPRFKYEQLVHLRKMVEKYSGIPIQPHEPIIGEGVFRHESGIHTAAIVIHPYIYQFLSEKDVGGEQRFVFGKHSGTAAVESVMKKYEKTLKENNIEISPELVDKMTELVKDMREKMIKEYGYEYLIQEYYRNYNLLGISEEKLIDLTIEKYKQLQLF